ncbi:MAG TPA: hypothetical protein VGT03_02080 [Candidatus Acidoferrales bacterium]|nr:hypothetical protein [Candidatus Acidoferrales bacterium]
MDSAIAELFVTHALRSVCLLHPMARVIMTVRMRLRPSLLLAVILLILSALPLFAADTPEILPLSEIHPGMKGVMYTIFSGDQIQQVHLTVIGILNNAMGPKGDIILVQLEGPEVEKDGVVAGMSGSPVYFDGKLAGAISLKIGSFTKDAIAGVTPIENMLDIENAIPKPDTAASPNLAASADVGAAASGVSAFPEKIELGSGKFLIPIETPLIFSGISPEALQRFSPELEAHGMSLMAGGTSPPSPDDANLKPGDMVGMDLVSGDLSLSAGCTVTAIIKGQIFICGHPITAFGDVAIPMSRGHVVMTLASSLESTKIMNTGGSIGGFTQDRLTGVVGKLGPAPPTIPEEVNFTVPGEQKHFHFNVAESPQLTATLVALSAYNGIVANPAYADGTTLLLDGHIDIKDHPAVDLSDTYVPTEAPVPNAFQLAIAVQSAFARIYTNPYELPKIQKVVLNITSISGRHLAAIDGAWCDMSEARPGETLHIKVQLRPYRGEPVIQEIPVTIPDQASRGNLEILVSDAAILDRARQPFGPGGQAELHGLDELIRMINRERQNDRLYVTLLQNSPTLIVEDKELPSVPASQLNVLDGGRAPGGSRMLFQSVIAEHSVEMHEVISGQHFLSITIK